MKPLDESLIDAARECDDCPCWLEHCGAECCTTFSFRLDPLRIASRTEDEVRIRVAMTPEKRRYYELHGAQVESDSIVVPANRCTFTQEALLVEMRCTALQPDLLCALHPDRKPEICINFNLETARREHYTLTPNCLYAYKLEPTSGDGT